MQLSNKHLFLIIIAVATVLRFFSFGNIPFTHDEFSALSRTGFSSFSELIEKGVMPDGHPAGVQVFLNYWVLLFGTAEWVVKLPFAVLGVLSVVLLYLIGKLWHSQTSALIAASFLASLQFFVSYSQIARPYISGMFFSLLLVYGLSLLIVFGKQNFLKHGVVFVLAAVLCAYNHHFSLLFAGIVGLTGIFLVPRDILLKYLLLGVIAVVLYFPHLQIFLYQLSVGGVGGWLAPPGDDFFILFTSYLFHHSIFVFSLVVFLVGIGWFYFKNHQLNVRMLSVFAGWFLFPLIIGFVYSRMREPVLQFSVLIFSTPFILLSLFGHIKDLSPRINAFLVTTVLLVNSLTLVFGREHYSVCYRSPYEHILTDYSNYQSQHPNIRGVAYTHKRISAYYSDSLPGLWLADGDVPLPAVRDSILGIAEKYEYLYVGGMSSIPPRIIPLVFEVYPFMLEKNDYFAGSTYLFSKVKHSFTFDRDTVFSADDPFIVDSLTEWGFTYDGSVKASTKHFNDFLDCKLMVAYPSSHSDMLLTSVVTDNGEKKFWNGCGVASVYSDTDSLEEATVLISLKLADIDYSDDATFSFGIWNRSKENISVKEFTVFRRSGNRLLYGNTEPLE